MTVKPCILIVDDEPQNRALLRAVLRSEYRTVEASDGASALEVLEKEAVDLVLLDVMMPGTTGYDVCREIKKRQGNRFTPVLLVTALSEQEQRNLGLQAGADDFLSKPVDRRELLLRVAAFVRLRQQDEIIRAQLRKVGDLQHMKDEMVALMVHDMRSPLAGVIANVQLLLEEVTDEVAREDARSALRGAEAVLQALDETLQIRLLEEGQLPIARAQVDLATLIREAAASFEPAARRKRIQLSTSVDGPAAASLDGKLVRRAIENLLGNALKYTPAGKDVSLALLHGADTVDITVSDRGPGIPAELKASMFQKFGSVEAKQGGPRKGFGLGLYMVKLVADGHDGEADVQDREGGGAVFRVRLRETG